MAKIGFIGLGLMGLPMACNLIRSGHAVKGMEIDKVQVDKLVAAGGVPAMSVKDAVSDVEVVVTMLPDLQHVREIYMRPNGVIASARAGALLIDCSTIDVEFTRTFAIAAERAGLSIVDAPTSGGISAAEAGRLTFMVGGPFSAYARAKPILTQMGTTIVHAGLAGNGQAAKICNNMILGVSMIAVSEAFALAEKLGTRFAKNVRYFVEVFRAVLGDDELLPGAWPCAVFACQPKLSGRLYRSDDVEGFEASAERGKGRRRKDLAWCRCF